MESSPPQLTTGAVAIAYAELGAGERTTAVIPGWVSHLDYDWSTPEIRAFYQGLAQDRRVIRYDKRGQGLSERLTGPETYRLDVQADDVIGVLDAAGVERAALLGWSMGGPIAITVAARYPERVSALVLYGTYARLVAAAGYEGLDPTVARGMAEVVRSEWGLGSRVLADLLVPESDYARLAWFTGYQRVATSAEAAAAFLRANVQHDVRDLLPTITQPALVLHRRGDNLVPLPLGQYLARRLPRGTFRALEGIHHTPYFGDTEALTQAVGMFLEASEVEDAGSAVGVDAALTERELDVLRLVAEGLQNKAIAQRLHIATATVSRHLANIYRKLGVSTRAGATAYALRRHLV